MFLNKKKLILLFIFPLLLLFTQPTKAENFQITNINISDITDQSAKINFSTNQVSQGKIRFGLEKDKYVYYANSNRSWDTYHEVDLLGLQPDTTYHFQAWAKNSSNENVFSNDFYFETEEYNDVLPPEISNIEIISITGTTATIVWETDEPARDTLYYGLNPECNKRKSSFKYQTFHELDLTNLSPDSRYYFYFQSKDSAGNIASSGILDFKTIDDYQSDQEPLEISYLSPISNNDSTITSQKAVISFETNRITNATLYWGEKDGRHYTLESQPPKKMKHSFLLENLKPETTYTFKITVSDIFNNKLSSQELSFVTKPDFQSPPSNPQQEENDSSTVVDDSSSDIEFFPPAFYTKPDKLVSPKEEDKIYAIYNNKKYWLSRPSIFLDYGYHWSQVQPISLENLNQYEDVRLVKVPNKSTVYLLENGQKRPIFSASVFERMGYQWQDIITISYLDLNQYADGQLLK